MRKIIFVFITLLAFLGCGGVAGKSEEDKQVEGVCRDFLASYLDQYKIDGKFAVVSAGDMTIYKGSYREKVNATEFNIVGKLPVRIKALKRLEFDANTSIERGVVADINIVFALILVKKPIRNRENKTEYYSRGNKIIGGMFLASDPDCQKKLKWLKKSFV